MNASLTRGIKLIVTAALTCVSLASCTGCERRVAIVNYRQVGACNGLTNLIGAGPHTVFVVFYIESIDNSKTSQDLILRRSRIQTNDYEPANSVATVQYSSALGIAPLKQSISVPKGTKAAVHQFVWFILGTGDPDGAKEANTNNYFLRYETADGDPGVAMTKLNSAQTSWPYTARCSEIQFPKAPGLSGIEEGLNPRIGK